MHNESLPPWDEVLSRWHEWSAVEAVASNLAAAILDQILDGDTGESLRTTDFS
jgi:hypothetical protein